MITLYDYTKAPSPRRARMFMAEKGIPFETIQIDLQKGEQMGEDYRKINPACTVPALKLGDGNILTDNAEIAAYLEAEYPENPLLGSTPMEKGNIAKWNAWAQFSGLMSVASALRNSAPSMKDRALPGPRKVKQIPELAERGKQQITWFMASLNKILSRREYVAGDSYSVADITATVAIDFASWVKVYPQEDQTALLAWHERMKARPSYKA